jgi:hypothetical protein
MTTGLLAFLAFAAGAAAQEKSSTAVLSRTELRELVVAADTPAEHAQLRNHFAALADRYAEDAKRHATMATAYGGNPNRFSGSDMAGHCKRLGNLATDLSKSARDLAAHHDSLAAGAPSTAPADPHRLHEGTGAPIVMSDAKLRSLVAEASSPAEHGKLQEYFTTLAAKYTADADAHGAMAAAYRGTPRPGASVAASHCDLIVAKAREAAAEAKALAAEHQKIAR